MAKASHHKTVQKLIESRGFFTTIRTHSDDDSDLVCASKRFEGGLTGNSFWLWFSEKAGDWYVATWTPRYYLIPATTDVVALCVSCLSNDSSFPWSLPEKIVLDFRLEEVSQSEIDEQRKRQG